MAVSSYWSTLTDEYLRFSCHHPPSAAQVKCHQNWDFNIATEEDRVQQGDERIQTV